jgi:hypothetical protein
MPLESLTEAVQRLARRGFRHDLRAERGRLLDLETGESFEPRLLQVAEVVRFEGESDPDEQAALFALRSPSGKALGTWAVAFGPIVPPEDGEVLRQLSYRPAPG